MTDVSAPDGLRAGGRALWAATAAGVTFDPGDAELLLEACRVKDTLDGLAAVVATQGPMLGDRVHPAVIEARQQQQVLAKLVVALRPSAEASGTSVSDAARNAANARWSKTKRSA